MFQTFHYCLFIALLSCAYGQHAESMNHPTYYKLTREQREELLKIHNDYRSDAAVRFGAANLEPLVWSSNLSDSTSSHHSIVECYFSPYGGFSFNYRALGENVAIQISVASTELTFNFTYLVSNWYSQYIHYNVTSNTCTAGCDLFLQMVSADSTAVGCSLSVCDKIDPFRVVFLSCHYDRSLPYAGHSLPDMPFVPGNPCSYCPEGKTRCVHYLCMPDENTAMMGSDPHFSVLLPSGSLLCYTVQGKRSSVFNLISNQHLEMNALFVPDPDPSDKVKTWLGQIGITVKGLERYIQLVFTAATSDISVNKKISIPSNIVEKLSFKSGRLVMMKSRKTRRPKVYIQYDDAGLHLSIVFVNDHHLDLVWHSTSLVTSKSGGLVGQFLNKGIKIDEENQLLTIPGEDPKPVMKRHVWRFVEKNLESESVDEEDYSCWTTIYPSNQGQGMIKGNYLDYEVKDILSA